MTFVPIPSLEELLSAEGGSTMVVLFIGAFILILFVTRRKV